MNKKKMIMSTIFVLSMTLGGLVGCSNQTSTTTQTTQNIKKTIVLGKKTDTSKKITFKNKTGKAITVFETKSTNDENFSDNLLKDGTVIASKQSVVVNFEPKENESLNIKIGLKNDESTYTFEKVDETLDTAKSYEIKLNDNKKPVISVTKKDDSITSIESTTEEAKTDSETKNEEKADETTKAESTSSESKSETASTETSKANTFNNSSSSNSNKTNSTASTSSSSSKNSSSSSSNSNSSSSSSQHTHNWVAQTKTVHHDEVGHYEQVKVGTIYHVATGIVHDICNVCGLDLTANNIDPGDHALQHYLNDGVGGGHHSEVVGYNNDAYTEDQYETKYVIDQQAYDETVTTGYKCSSCGKTK